MSASQVLEKVPLEMKAASMTGSNDAGIEEKGDSYPLASGSQHLQRKLRVKEVQLYALSAAIGTCTLLDSFLSISN